MDESISQSEAAEPPSPLSSFSSSCSLQQPNNLHSFSHEVQDGILHFQILKLDKQLYIWVGCNSAKLGQLYASMPTRFEKIPSLATLIGGSAESVGASIARRLALKTGWSIVLACNLPKNSPNLEAQAEKRLLQELKALEYTKGASSSSWQGSQVRFPWRKLLKEIVLLITSYLSTEGRFYTSSAHQVCKPSV